MKKDVLSENSLDPNTDLTRREKHLNEKSSPFRSGMAYLFGLSELTLDNNY
eukprot:CAMPEP_0201505840 /NCGR_PEP_ID=MMETSP0151_2-20130828/86011_1 /ASSEMBLY_ACC=CAM_ASM_000257 /TAXON_ID=200890 /ORGANISM="Paramoeba atlantica, Strain 621/1 / CCAP 1560/9" /LENGTH=50 /DNA_ID=CAMNT_0047899787 /DNA_START=295 /DNA_END=447 /DNA_ORIENTATION=-